MKTLSCLYFNAVNHILIVERIGQMRRQGRFWLMHDALFQLNGELDAKHREVLVKQFMLDQSRLRKDYLAADTAVQQDKQDAETLSVSGTPTFFLGAPNKQAWQMITPEQADAFVP